MRSILGVIIFFLDVWAIVSILGSSATRNEKILWSIGVALLPVLGFIAWLAAGPRANQG